MHTAKAEVLQHHVVAVFKFSLAILHSTKTSFPFCNRVLQRGWSMLASHASGHVMTLPLLILCPVNDMFVANATANKLPTFQCSKFFVSA